MVKNRTLRIREYYVYMLTNKSGTLYTGVTNDLQRRVAQHKSQETEGFTKRYNIKHLVYYETFDDIEAAIAREKQIKGWVRAKKLELIKGLNPLWRDLGEDLFEDGDASTGSGTT